MGKRYPKKRSSKNTNKKDFSPELIPGKHCNDVSWDKKLPALVTAASGLYFNKRYGTNYDVIPGYSFNSANTAVPGVVALPFRLTLTQRGVDADAINVCAKNLYTYLRHANSGASNYEQSDLIQMIITVLGCAIHFEQAKRCLRLVPTYSATNIYVFRSALKAMGFTDPVIEDMIDNQANYVAKLNTIGARLNTFKIPKDFAVFDRTSWMVTNIFKDDQLEKSTYYFYFMQDALHYDWSLQKVTQSEFSFGSLNTFDDYLKIIDAEINNLLAYEDIGIMIGDVLKAYKAEGCRVWSPMQIGEVQDSSYEPEVLSQIMNTVTIPAHGTIENEQVTLNSQLLKMSYSDSTGASYVAGHIGGPAVEDTTQSYPITGFNNYVTPLLVINSDNPTNDDVIVSTRCTQAPLVTDHSGPGFAWPLLDVEVHNLFVVTDIVVIARNSSGQDTKDVIHTITAYTDAPNDLLYEARSHKYSRLISAFPTLYRILLDNSQKHFFAYYSGKNVVTITKAWLDTLNDGCTQSEFTLPMFKLLEAN